MPGFEMPPAWEKHAREAGVWREPQREPELRPHLVSAPPSGSFVDPWREQCQPEARPTPFSSQRSYESDDGRGVWSARELAGTPASSRGPVERASKRAVVVSVGYEGTSCALLGAQQDGRLWLQALQKLGFEREQVRVLGADEPATRDGIWEALKWLMADAERGDTLIFVFCGHATDVSMNDGGFAGCLLPSDFCGLDGSAQGDAPRWIPTSWITHEVARLPCGVDVVLLFDASVYPLDLGASRKRDREVSRRLAAQAFAKAPPNVGARFVTIDPCPQWLCRYSSPAVACNCFCFTATRPGEVALELVTDSRVRGVFTYIFCKALRDALRGRESVSYLDLAEASAAALARFTVSRGFEQAGVTEKPQSFALSRSPRANLGAPFANFAGNFHKTDPPCGPTSSASTRASSGW